MQFLEHRIPPPVVAVLAAVLIWTMARHTPAIPIADGLRVGVALNLWLAAVLIAGAALLDFRRARTTVNPVDIDAASALVTSGVFRFTRNPMYLGLATLLTGWVLYLAAPWGLVGVAAFVLYLSRFQIVPEERVMQAKFGDVYQDYRNRVRRWL
jgi:protein-S-isoprenylcysteine O-methyltransferase Ste14